MRMQKMLLLSAALAALCGTVLAQSRALPGPAGEGQAGMAERAKSDRQERYDLAHKIVSEWGPYVKAIYGEDVGPWARRLTPTLQRADTGKLREAANADTFEGMMNGLTGQRAPDPSLLPGGITPKALGDTAADLVFTPLAQCNLLDTRLAGGAFTAGVFKHFKASGASFVSQGGSNTNCGIPANVRALMLGVTAVDPTAKGWFKLWPYGQTQPAASSMSFGPGQNTRNDLVLRVSQGLEFDFTAGSQVSGVNLLVTVVGYYAPPEATALQCVTTARGELVIAAGSTGNSSAPACGAGYTQTGTNCESSSWEMPFVYSSAGTCSARNNGGSSATLSASRRCCRVPGR